MAKTKTKTPTGLGIKRDGMHFTLSWKINDKDYGGGQQLEYYVETLVNKSKAEYNKDVAAAKKAKKDPKKVSKTKTVKEWHKVQIGAKTTSRLIKLSAQSFYPYTSKKVTTNKKTKKKVTTYVEKDKMVSIGFRVRGLRKDWKETKGSGKSKKTTKHEYSWSDWTKNKEFNLAKPPKPTLTVSTNSSDSQVNTSTFTGTAKVSTSNAHVFTRTQWQSILIKDSSLGGNKVTWSKARLNQKGEGGINVGFDSTGGASVVRAITEDTSTWNTYKYSYTRYFRIRSQGPNGDSGWTYVDHTYSLSNQAKNVSAKIVDNSGGGGYFCTVTWEVDSNKTHPSDMVTPKYTIQTPELNENNQLEPSDGTSWTDTRSVKDTSGKDGLTFSVDGKLQTDQCMFVRVDTKHDGWETYGKPVLVTNGVGALAAPTSLSVTPDGDAFNITATNNCTISGSFLGIYYKDTGVYTKEILIGIISGSGQHTKSVLVPDIADGVVRSFGVRAFIGEYSPEVPDEYEYTQYTISPINGVMRSKIVWDGGGVLAPPTDLNVVQKPTDPSIAQISWQNKWTELTGTEISWADHSDAWESTDEPSTYIISNSRVNHWNVAGLSSLTYWFRVRSIKEEDDVTTYSSYSEPFELKLSAVPAIPSLTLSDRVVAEDGEVTCYWSYVSTDGSSQGSAKICEAFVDEDIPQEKLPEAETESADVKGDGEQSSSTVTSRIVYGEPFLEVSTGSHATFKIADRGWHNGETHKLCLKVSSRNGDETTSWSNPVEITIANQPIISIVDDLTSLVNRSVVVDDETGETQNKDLLTTLPLVVTVERSDDSASIVGVIERAEDRPFARPDESFYDGYEGETIAIMGPFVDDKIEFKRSDIIGNLDDGGTYRIIISITDIYGQSNEVQKEFDVSWDHQASDPEAEIVIDQERRIALIRPYKPEYVLSYDETVDQEKTYYQYDSDSDTYTAVTPQGSENPLDSEWYEHKTYTDESGYEASTDLEVVTGKTYYDFDEELEEYVAVTPIGTESPQSENWFEFKIYPDVCDIYRLSADPPELIVYGATFGELYVDPYPAIGDLGGYRVVWRTANGDYTTPDNNIAWMDYGMEADTTLNIFDAIIDFDGKSVSLPYNLSFSNSWAKDFVETQYLGGSVQGDWNLGVSRTSSLNSLGLAFEDPDSIKRMRELAVYAGPCHVRTPDGSSYEADVQVQENREEKWTTTLASFSLNITRVDSEELDGMLYSDWLNIQGA